MKENKSEFGKIKYELPAIDDAMVLLGLMGVRDESNDDQNSELIYMGKLIKHMGICIREVNIKIGKSKIDNYDDAKKHFCMMKPLSEIAGDIMSVMNLEEDQGN